MEHINKSLRHIKRRIMLRVWYCYFLSLLEAPATLVAALFTVSTLVFVQLVSVPSIIVNILNVRVGLLPEYLWSTVAHALLEGELLKVISLVLILVSSVYLVMLLRQYPLRRVRSI